jgi:glycerate 2-kinase
VRILLAPDKFAGTMTADAAAAALGDGWRQAAPDDVLVTLAMSDGGPGFLDAVRAAMDAPLVPVRTTGPNGAVVSAPLLLVDGERRTAYLEAATCCGQAIAPEPRQPLEASSAGLVPLIEAALAAGAGRIVVGVGGTASTDGGRPLVEALSGRMPADVDLVVATDVENPLLGVAGAARSFAPQKGANEAEVAVLEQRLASWAAGADVDPTQPGAGAGGGLGYGLLRLGGRRVSGAAVVADALGLDQALAASDLVVTGEGRLDFSSLSGKVVSFVAGRAQAAARPCVAVVGSSLLGRREAAAAGIDEIYSLQETVGVGSALAHPEDALRRVAQSVARDWSHC